MVTPTIAEALEALKLLDGSSPTGFAYHCARIRSVLEAAAKEQADWEAIEAWLKAERSQERALALEASGPVWEAFLSRVMPSDDGSAHIVRGGTRAEALAAAAAWCRERTK